MLLVVWWYSAYHTQSQSYFHMFFSVFFSLPLNNMLHLQKMAPDDWSKHLTACSLVVQDELSFLRILQDIFSFQLEGDKWVITAPSVCVSFQLQ